MEKKEKVIKPNVFNSGIIHLLINLALLFVPLGFILTDSNYYPVCIVCWVLWFIHLCGFVVIFPNVARVFYFLGHYRGTLRSNGLYWVIPFYGKTKISMRLSNLDVEPIKVNDLDGNPIMIGLVLVWRVEDSYRAIFDLQTADLEQFVAVQSDAALRKVASLYSYDNNTSGSGITLRNGGDEINAHLEEELRKHLEIAGIDVVEARINHIAYAPEIASAMLRRQQAEAIITAREKIVDGAVSMVEMALKRLAESNCVQLDEERKAAMVSNLLVVLCSDESASPVINTGSIYQ